MLKYCFAFSDVFVEAWPTVWKMLWKMFQSVFLWIENIIYSVAAGAYTIFYRIVQLSDPNFRSAFSSMDALIDRIKLFIGLFIMFNLVIVIINGILDPEKNSQDVEKSGTEYVKRIIIIVGLLIAYPFVFDLLDEAQATFLGVNGKGGNVIARIALGTEAAESITGEDAGRQFMDHVWLSFITVNDKNFVYSEEACDNASGILGDLCDVYFGEENIGYLLDTDIFEEDKVSWQYPVVSGLIGGLFLIMFIQYAFDAAGRLFLLLLLQALAPIPIICYIDTKKGDDILKQYIQHYLTSYLELFMNVSLLFISVALCKTISNVSAYVFSIWSTKDNMGLNAFSNILIIVILYIAIFRTMRNLPKLIDEIFGTKLSEKFSEKFKDGIKTVGLGANLLRGGAAALTAGYSALGMGAGNVARAALGGLVSNTVDSFKNINKTQNVKDIFNRDVTKNASKNAFDHVTKYPSVLGKGSWFNDKWTNTILHQDQWKKNKGARYQNKLDRSSRVRTERINELNRAIERYDKEHAYEKDQMDCYSKFRADIETLDAKYRDIAVEAEGIGSFYQYSTSSAARFVAERENGVGSDTRGWFYTIGTQKYYADSQAQAVNMQMRANYYSHIYDDLELNVDGSVKSGKMKEKYVNGDKYKKAFSEIKSGENYRKYKNSGFLDEHNANHSTKLSLDGSSRNLLEMSSYAKTSREDIKSKVDKQPLYGDDGRKLTYFDSDENMTVDMQVSKAKDEIAKLNRQVTRTTQEINKEPMWRKISAEASKKDEK